MTHFSRSIVCAGVIVGGLVMPAGELFGQSPDRALESAARRLSLTLQGGQFNPSGNSEAFRLFDSALSRGTDALTPRLTGASFRVRVWKQLSLTANLEAGQRTVRSHSLSRPASFSGEVAQQTRLDFTQVRTLGAQWQAWAWRQQATGTTRLRVYAGAGLGQVRYDLRQWGTFVDASRLVAFDDDLASRGRGSIRFIAATAEMPLNRWAAVQVDVRGQHGSAAMSHDFSSFDALDLSGRRYTLGLTLTPWR